MNFLTYWFRKLYGRTTISAQGARTGRQTNTRGPLTLQHVLDEFRHSDDLTRQSFPESGVELIYFSHLLDQHKLDRDVIRPLSQAGRKEVPNLLRQSQFHQVTDRKDLIEGVLKGQVAIFHQNRPYLIDVFGPKERAISESETETVITGPHDAFNENAGANLSLIRKRVKSSHLKVVKLSVGEVAKSDVYVLYIEDIVNPVYVQSVIGRIRRIEIDAVTDTSMLIQCLDDSPLSIFPQFLTSERPDAVASKLVSGRVIGLMDGSSSAFSAPTSFFEFFASSDDYYQRWLLGTATRILRFAAFAITMTFTALYVAVATYHYEMIPANLLPTFVESRSRVPFPPVYEALLMETTIELLREAGARLPTKIGQTIGIVGGIVIGQAAVQAGFTSNILIIAVASSAIASFVIPSYVMSASIRLIRFGLILLAGIWGNFGLALGIAFVVIHLSGLTSLGASYINPVAPLRFKDWSDTFIRAPFKSIKERPTQTETPNPVKMKMRK